MVRDHDGEGHRFDDHHRGGGRQPAEKGCEGDQVGAVAKRQRQHRHVAVDLAGTERGEAGEGERHHEDVDEDEVEREQPGDAAHVLDGAVLDDRHVELAGQQERGEARQDDEGEERPEAGRLAEEDEIGAPLGGFGQDVVDAAEHPERHEHPDRQEGDQLDDRFEGDREHQPVLMLGRVRVARAEGDRESGQHDRHDESKVAEDRHRAGDGGGVRGGEEDAERSRYRLQLQGDVGNGADHGDEAHERRDALALAVAGGDEIGDRGDVLRLGDAHDPGDEGLAEADHQDRADIDGDEVEAGAAGEPDRAEERPRGAVDRQGQRIDGRSRRPLHETAAGLVAPMGDREQAAQINEGRQNDPPAGDHEGSSECAPAGSLAARQGRRHRPATTEIVRPEPSAGEEPRSV